MRWIAFSLATSVVACANASAPRRDQAFCGHYSARYQHACQAICGTEEGEGGGDACRTACLEDLHADEVYRACAPASAPRTSAP